MTKTRIKTFFSHPCFVLDNKAWWLGDIGFLLFDRSLLMLKGRDSDRPGLLLIQKLKDISFLGYDERMGVIVGSKKMTEEARRA